MDIVKYEVVKVSKGSRVLTAIADLFLLAFIAMISFGVGVSKIVSSTSKYQEANLIYESSYVDMEDIYVSSHLLSKDEKGKLHTSREVTNLYLSNKINDSDFDSNGDYLDIFVYSMVSYASNFLTVEGEKIEYSVKRVNEELYKFNVNEVNAIWEMNGDINNPLHLTKNAKEKINEYLNEAITLENKQIYDEYYQGLLYRLETVENILLSSDQFSSAQIKANDSHEKMLKMVGDSSFFTFTILYFLYFLVLPMLFKNGQTLCKKMLNIKMFYKDGHSLPLKNLIAKSILSYFAYFFLYPFTSYLFIGNFAFNLPLFYIGKFSFTSLVPVAISLLVCITNLIYLLINKDGETLIDKLSYQVAGKSTSIIKEEKDEDRN